MARKGENIYKRKDGRWEGRFIKNYDGGRVHYFSVYAKSYREVKEKLSKAKVKFENEKNTGQNKAGTLSKVSAAWLSDVSQNLKESTLIKYEDLLRLYILPEFGECELSEITNEQLTNFGNRLLAEGGTKKQGLARAIVIEILSAMNSIRIHAIRQNCTVVFTPECVNFKRGARNIRVFSAEEERKLIEYLCIHESLTGVGILLCLFTGIRIGEICALTWNDIDLGAGMVKITKAMQRIRVQDNVQRKSEVRIMKPKSDCSLRTIPVPRGICMMLEKHYKEDAFVLSGSKDKFVEPRTLQYRFKSVLKKCGIEDANFHTTRHTFATRCVEKGFDVKCLAEILGHASVSITLNRYVHPAMKLKEENMELLSDMLPAMK